MAASGLVGVKITRVAYDGDGNRVSETVGGVTTNYLVDAQNPTGYAQVVDELQGSTVTRTYSYGLEQIAETWGQTERSPVSSRLSKRDQCAGTLLPMRRRSDPQTGTKNC